MSLGSVGAVDEKFGVAASHGPSASGVRAERTSRRSRVSAARPFRPACGGCALAGTGPGLEDGVGIGPSETEGVDAGRRGLVLVRLEWLQRRRHAELERLEIDVRVRLEEVQIWRDPAVAQHQGDLDDAGDAGAGLEVADVGLDRADDAGVVGWAILPQHRAEGVGLDRIADGRAGAVRLDVADGAGHDARAPARLARQGLLGARQGTVMPLVRPSWFTAVARMTA